MEHIIQIVRLQHPISYDDGSTTNYLVRIVSAPQSMGGRVIHTGEHFEHAQDALQFARGAHMAFKIAHIPTRIDLPTAIDPDDSVSLAGSPASASCAALYAEVPA